MNIQLNNIQWHSDSWNTPDGKNIPCQKANVTELLFGDNLADCEGIIAVEITHWPRKVTIDLVQEYGEDSYTNEGSGDGITFDVIGAIRKRLVTTTRPEFEAHFDALMAESKARVSVLMGLPLTEYSYDTQDLLLRWQFRLEMSTNIKNEASYAYDEDAQYEVLDYYSHNKLVDEIIEASAKIHQHFMNVGKPRMFLANRSHYPGALDDRAALMLATIAADEFLCWQWQHGDINRRNQLERAGYIKPRAFHQWRIAGVVPKR